MEKRVSFARRAACAVRIFGSEFIPRLLNL
jgi:hypothetical protein